VPVSILLGFTVIMLVGLLDDVIGVRPGVKVGGQLVAAAALALDDVGVKVASGVIMPVARSLDLPTIVVEGSTTFGFVIPIGGIGIPVDIVYWAGAAIIAVFVLGACNASNLIDGLDGLLTGTTAITTAGLLVVALTLAAFDDGPRDGQRIVLCMALLGACLGFLPHNFNPATIFLGDCGSLLLGFATIVIVLTLGDTGKTQLVLAGLIMYAVPIIDTVLAIVRRKLAGRPLSEADDQHLHHMLSRALGVKGAALTLYAIAGAFTALGVVLSLSRARLVYALVLIIACYMTVAAIKIARRKQLEESIRTAPARRWRAGGPVATASPPLEAPAPEEQPAKL
jgi:UDP-GlcNAc:undecaprenyl-phosphate/decaprenyl-phosphate GlcNAc-1-phosphate transferase